MAIYSGHSGVTGVPGMSSALDVRNNQLSEGSQQQQLWKRRAGIIGSLELLNSACYSYFNTSMGE